jgi:ribosomal protein S18 acetylase RimI-like enzyme
MEPTITIEEFNYDRHVNLSYAGFFVGWREQLSEARLVEILRGSYLAYIAIREDSVVGFVYSISDGILSCYIPLLEVLPEYQRRGLGTELVQRLVGALGSFYMVDLTCDREVRTFYEKAWPGMKAGTAMVVRNYDALKAPAR